jgi:dTDP-4-dehydrorhamnose reductase
VVSGPFSDPGWAGILRGSRVQDAAEGELRILVLGAQGQLGSELVKTLSPSHQVVGKDIGDFDITERDKVLAAVESVGPAWVVNAAAYTRVDTCETEAQKAFAVNGSGPRHVAEACKVCGARLLHVSTDYVFDGRKEGPYDEEDPPNPLSVYGHSKFKGEEEVRRTFNDWVLVRTSWLYGKRGHNFVATVLGAVEERRDLKVVDDQRGCPTSAVDVSEAVRALLEGDHRGLFHAANSGSCSWYELASHVVSLVGGSISVRPITAAQLGRPAGRPSNSVLNCQKFTRVTGYSFRCWKHALDEHLRDREVKR